MDDSSQVGAVVSAMTWMLEHEDEYQQMRKRYGQSSRTHSREQFEERLLAYVRDEQSRYR